MGVAIFRKFKTMSLVYAFLCRGVFSKPKMRLKLSKDS